MNIIFSPDTFLLQSYGGISRYFVRMGEAMLDAGHHVRVPAKIHFNHYLNTSLLGKNKFRISRDTKITRRFTRLLNGGTLQLEAAKPSTDIVHFTYFRRFPPIITQSKKVVTVFDMIDELFHKEAGQENLITKLKRRATREADLILCISENTKQDLIRLFDIPSSKIVVTYLAADLPPPINEADQHPLRGSPFLLYVGNRWGYKNFKAAVECFARNKDYQHDFKFVAFGSDSFAKEEIELFKALGLDETNMVHAKGSDSDLYNYYRHATAFIYPSLYEGFGIPPLEAMSVGCPVVCSNVSSIPEIVGDAAFQFDPNQPETLDAALETALSDSTERFKKIDIGYKQFQRFSWQKCAADTLLAYEQVLGVKN